MTKNSLGIGQTLRTSPNSESLQLGKTQSVFLVLGSLIRQMPSWARMVWSGRPLMPSLLPEAWQVSKKYMTVLSQGRWPQRALTTQTVCVLLFWEPALLLSLCKLAVAQWSGLEHGQQLPKHCHHRCGGDHTG